MPLNTTKIQLPKSVVTRLAGKVQGTSVIAALSPAQPQIFADDTTMIFNPTAEAEVVAEGAKKGSYEQNITPVVGKRFKVVTTTRMSNELKWADEDNQLEIISNIMNDQVAALGRALDYVVFHAINPYDGEALSGFTALTSGAKTVTATNDAVADIDSMIDAIIDYNITGIGLARQFTNDLRKVRADGTGQRLYPEIPLNLKVGNFDGIPAATSNTVDGVLADTKTNVLAIMGDYDLIKWGMVRDIWSEIIEYGDPDGTGNDLKAYNQIAYRTEAVFSYAVLDASGFAVLKGAGE